MPFQIDAPKQNPLLSDMQGAALDKLSKNKKGFFLMVEGASIDKQG
ncbi:alkaline phosphatase, partial [Staphylococcus chromogenes]